MSTGVLFAYYSHQSNVDLHLYYSNNDPSRREGHNSSTSLKTTIQIQCSNMKYSIIIQYSFKKYALFYSHRPLRPELIGIFVYTTCNHGEKNSSAWKRHLSSGCSNKPLVGKGLRWNDLRNIQGRLGRHFLWCQVGSHLLDQSLAVLAKVALLPNPNLRNVLGINRRLRRVQGHLIQHSMNGSGEKDQGHALLWLNAQIQTGEMGTSALLDIVQVNQDCNGTLTTIGCKSSAIFLVQVEGIKVLSCQ